MMEIPLGTVFAKRRGVALIDDEDYELVSPYNWYIGVDDTRRYAQTNIRREDGSRTGVKMHQLITGFARTDHIDGNGLNNQRSNLRAATNGQNMANRRPNAGASSAYKGVSARREGFWVAEIQVNKARRYLGCFWEEEEAARAYDLAALELFGEFARLNFPEVS